MLPLKNRLENGVAAFPEEIPYRLIKLFSYVGETVLDPFMGSGTTNKVASILKRNSIGYEIDLELLETVKEKMGLKQNPLFEKDYDVEIIIRDDAQHLRTQLQSKVNSQKSVVKNEQEKTLRYLLLRVLINQQAKFEKVRELSLKMFEEFSDNLLFEPHKISETKLFEVFKEVAGEKGSLLYRVGALGGIKPISLFTYRYKAIEINRSLIDVVTKKLQDKGSTGLFQFLNTHSVLKVGWVGKDPKACRMLVNWIIFLFNEI